MSFRLKLATAFSSILFLTITVGLTSWWGMDTALNRQNTIFSFSQDVDRLFSTISHNEHSFIITKNVSYSRSVNRTLDELYSSIELMHEGLHTDHRQYVRNVLDGIRHYQSDFSEFSRQMVDMETIKSRMIRESDRLMANAGSMAESGSGRAVPLLQRVSRMLQAEKDYMLTNTVASASQVADLAKEVEQLAQRAMKEGEESSQRLKAFRIAKVAGIYHDIFARFQKVQRVLIEMTHDMHHASDMLEKDLRLFMDAELEASQSHVNKLQLITIAVSLFAVALSVIITILLSSRITRPLNQLKHSAMNILQGNLDTKVTIESRDEIGQLGDLFNQMTVRLRKNFDDIIQYRDQLEDLVADRTKELKIEVAERTAAEYALRASEKQLRTIVDESPMGIILWDADFRVIQWNPAAEKIFGYTSEEAMGLYADQLLPESMHQHIGKILIKLITSESGVRSHNENIHKDGSTINCDWFNTPIIDSSGAVLGALSLVENVSERIRTEKELIKIKKLESTGILAGGIAHDFNNILTAILGNINLSLFDKGMSESTRELLVAAEKASIRAKDLTHQLLTFAKGGEPIRESTSLAAIIRDSAAFVLHGGNVSCSYKIPDNLWLALVDRGQISQVIQNIVLNARHAMPEGGVIEISGENVLPGEETFRLLEKGKQYVKLSIKDNGIGIPATLLDKVFDPYFSTKQEGSGLGLAITLSIVNKHHGHILVDSDLQKGTEFVIYLPATQKVLGSEEEHGQVAFTPGNLKVLVMDDDEIVQEVVQAMLEVQGHSVQIANSGREAIELYQSRLGSAEAFDLVLVDLTIPGGLGGKDTMAELLRIDPNVRGIVSSGYSNDPVMASYREYGFQAAATKPFVLADLTAAIEMAFADS